MVTLGESGKISMFVWTKAGSLPSDTAYDPTTETSTVKNNFSQYIVRGWLTGKTAGRASFEVTLDGCVKSTLLNTKGNKVLVVAGEWDTSDYPTTTSQHTPFFGYIKEQERVDADKIKIICRQSISDSEGNQLANKVLSGLSQFGRTIGDLFTTAFHEKSRPQVYSSSASGGEGTWYSQYY